VFEVFRSQELPYWQIFLATSVLYGFGTISYLELIRTVEKRAENSPETAEDK
jgi:hypothetical protein